MPETVTVEASQDEPRTEPSGKVVEYEETKSLGGPILRGFSKALGVIEAAIGPMQAQKLIDFGSR